MKAHIRQFQLILFVVMTAIGFFSAQTAEGQFVATNYVVDQFDTDTTTSYTNLQWGTVVPAITWDGNTNAVTSLGPNNPGSGASKWVVPWSSTTTNDQIAAIHWFAGGGVINLSNFNTISFDIMFSNNSATDGHGSYGGLEVGIVPSSDLWLSASLGNYFTAVTNGNSWVHVTLPVSTNYNISGIGIKMLQNRTGYRLTGTTTFWLDNLIFSGYSTVPVAGPPQMIQLNSAQTWQRLEFQVTNVPTASNPFNPTIISLDATFTAPSGKTFVVPAFWYQGYNRSLAGNTGTTEVDAANGAPQWRIRFTPVETGAYSLSLAIQTNGQAYGTFPTNFTVASNSTPARFGYVGIASGNRYFQTGDGQALPLNGACVCWPGTKATYDYDSWFSLMNSNIENYARIWMWPPSQGYFGIECTPGTLNNYAMNPAWQLDYVFQLAEQKGIYLQLCLDFHGMYWITNASKANNDWQYNPYNSANGGPCIQPNAYFTNSTAQTLYQYRLRYLIGRYGYSQNLLSWEFFNEIDNTFTNITGAPASQSVNYNDCLVWHTNMAGWMKNHDPNHHLLTTSLTQSHVFTNFLNLPQLDYNQDHFYGVTGPATYSASDSASFLATYGKLMMIGEYGISYNGLKSGNPGDPYSRGFRQGVWGGALGGSAGTAMCWWWDSFNSTNFQVYGSLGKILSNTGWGAGQWTPISFTSSYAIGMRGSSSSLVYLTASGATWPTGAKTAPGSLTVQTGTTLTLNNWPSGTYSATWYDPMTAAPLGTNTATTSGSQLTLSLPNYSDDLAAIIMLATPVITSLTPLNPSVGCSSNITFTVAATGSAPLSYQWSTNSTPVGGATFASFSLNNVQFPSPVTVSVTVTNGFGSVSSNSLLTIIDTIPPIITLNGSNPLTVECHGSFTDPGATAYDACAGSVGVTVSGSVNANDPGSYTLTYTADDGNGNTNSTTRIVNVVDTTPPVITLNGANPLTVECHGGFMDPGATASDACAGSVVVHVSGSVNANDPGSYTLTYTADDGNGNTNSTTRAVNVVDTTPPVISWSFTNLALSLDTNCSVLMPDVTGTNYILAADACSGILVITQIPTNNAVLALGTNQVVLAVNDGNGNTAYSTNTVVVQDTTPPVVTVLGNNPLTIECHGSFSDPGAMATDNCTLANLVTNGMVNVDVPGNYTLEYVATDAAGNSTTNTRIVNVVDTTPPAITLIGDNPLTVECHGGFTDPGATAYDACAGIVGVRVSGSVNANDPGSYTLTYTADDGNSNTNSATRIVNVVDTTPPAITQCASPMTLITGTNGMVTVPNLTSSVSAIDACSGNVTISQSPLAGASLPVGTNTVIIAADDGNGNTNTCSATVTVLALMPPVILSGQWANGTLQLIFTGQPDQTYNVLATGDLTVSQTGWLVLTNGTFGTNASIYVDLAATNYSARFYRISSP